MLFKFTNCFFFVVFLNYHFIVNSRYFGLLPADSASCKWTKKKNWRWRVHQLMEDMIFVCVLWCNRRNGGRSFPTSRWTLTAPTGRWASTPIRNSNVCCSTCVMKMDVVFLTCVALAPPSISSTASVTGFIISTAKMLLTGNSMSFHFNVPVGLTVK